MITRQETSERKLKESLGQLLRAFYDLVMTPANSTAEPPTPTTVETKHAEQMDAFMYTCFILFFYALLILYFMLRQVMLREKEFYEQIYNGTGKESRDVRLQFLDENDRMVRSNIKKQLCVHLIKLGQLQQHITESVLERHYYNRLDANTDSGQNGEDKCTPNATAVSTTPGPISELSNGVRPGRYGRRNNRVGMFHPPEFGSVLEEEEPEQKQANEATENPSDGGPISCETQDIQRKQPNEATENASHGGPISCEPQEILAKRPNEAAENPTAGGLISFETQGTEQDTSKGVPTNDNDAGKPENDKSAPVTDSPVVILINQPSQDRSEDSDEMGEQADTEEIERYDDAAMERCKEIADTIINGTSVTGKSNRENGPLVEASLIVLDEESIEHMV